MQVVGQFYIFIIKMFKIWIGIYILIITVSYAIYPAKIKYLPDIIYSYDYKTYWDPNTHTAPKT